MRFEWDEEKDLENQSKHGVSFSDAQSLFEQGSEYLELFDAEHSTDEDRFIAIGPSDVGMLVVVWSDEGPDVVRIITARPVSKRERRLFRERMAELQ